VPAITAFGHQPIMSYKSIAQWEKSIYLYKIFNIFGVSKRKGEMKMHKIEQKHNNCF